MDAAMLPNAFADMRVLEFTHAIMGPACGMTLADLGAEVIKVEPAPKGDPTRYLSNSGLGYFLMFNRNKKSLTVNLKAPEGKAIIDRWIDRADVIIENYAPGTMARLGLGYEQVAERNPRIVYCSLKGFMEGPYEQRTALDEPVQMMSGLAYMTGPPGQPLRAGTSIMDILGATYGALGILAALRERDQTGKGQFVQTGLFEAAAYAMGQHLAHAALRDDPLQPYPGQVRAWAIYQLFDTSDHRQVFIGVTSDHHWARFCEVFNRPDLYGDSSLTTNNQRCAAHDWLIPELKRMFKTLTFEEITDRCETGGFPYAPVNHPEDLWNNPHLNAGTWLDTTFPNPHADITAKLPRQPLLINHQGHTIRQNPPNVGEHTAELLAEVGFNEKTIQELSAQQIIVT